MQAKFVYEAIGDVLKPKSEEDIISSMKDLDRNILFIKSIENRFLLGVKMALERGANIHLADNDALRWASENGHYDLVKLLLDSGADVHAQNDYALRWASHHGHYDVVKLLIDNGANVHAKNDSALRYASLEGHYDIVELLEK
ncbi:MAG: ankyrin repeat domain-containing protein [Nitrosopumilus sp.]